jgi:ankyrin repeat protein
MIVTRNVGGLLSVVAVLALVGCSGGSESSSGEAKAQTAVETPSVEMASSSEAKETKPEVDPLVASKQAMTVDPDIAAKKAQEKAELADTSRVADPHAATAEPSHPTTLVVEPAKLDMGEVSTNKYATGTVRLVNSGDEPITIQDCKSSCGCTSTNCPKGKELQPGETADVDIRITAGSRERKISKTVTFRVIGQQPVIVPVTVQVIAYVAIQPMTIDPEQSPDGKVVIVANDDQPFRITSMSPPIIESFPADESTKHEVFLDWDAWKELGQSRRIIFNIDHPESNQVSLVVRTTPVRRAQNRTDVQSPIRDTADRLKAQGVDDRPLAPAEPPAAAAIAIKNGQVDKIKEILSEGDGLTEPQRNDLLSKAAMAGQVEIMEVLIKAGADAKSTDKRGRTPLMAAVQSHKPEAVRYLIEQGADVNARDSLQGTALLRAAGSFGDVESVQVLLSAGAEVNIKDKSGMTPLMWAARWGDPQRVQALLTAGANVEARDGQGRTALDWARTQGDKGRAIVEILQPLTKTGESSGEPGEPKVE